MATGQLLMRVHLACRGQGKHGCFYSMIFYYRTLMHVRSISPVSGRVVTGNIVQELTIVQADMGRANPTKYGGIHRRSFEITVAHAT
jgi:hypothetical protein